MTPARFVRSLALLAVCVLSGACATTRYTQSRIETLPPGVEGRPGSRASLEVEGLRFGVQVLDRTPQQQAVRRLALRLVFEPVELGYSFDPGQVVLRTADGRESRPTGGAYVPLYPRAAFDLVFGVAVEPDTEAELVLGGLARGTRRLEPVSVVLARHPGRSIDRMYWLEALAIPLSILTYPYGGM